MRISADRVARYICLRNHYINTHPRSSLACEDARCGALDGVQRARKDRKLARKIQRCRWMQLDRGALSLYANRVSDSAECVHARRKSVCPSLVASRYRLSEYPVRDTLRVSLLSLSEEAEERGAGRRGTIARAYSCSFSVSIDAFSAGSRRVLIFPFLVPLRETPRNAVARRREITLAITLAARAAWPHDARCLRDNSGGRR